MTGHRAASSPEPRVKVQKGKVREYRSGGLADHQRLQRRCRAEEARQGPRDGAGRIRDDELHSGSASVQILHRTRQ